MERFFQLKKKKLRFHRRKRWKKNFKHHYRLVFRQTANNFFFVVVDSRQEFVLKTFSSGMKFKNSRKDSPYATQLALGETIKFFAFRRVRRLVLEFKTPVRKKRLREVLKTFFFKFKKRKRKRKKKARKHLLIFKVFTPAHNGCRFRKTRRP